MASRIAPSTLPSTVAAYDAKPAFDWHPGLMFDWATLQVSFLADLVSLVRPTSRWSFLQYLVDRDRMYPFYIAERFHIPRREYADYCGWVAASLPSCRFGTTVTALEWQPDRRVWTLTLRSGGTEQRQDARNVVLGVGTQVTSNLLLRYRQRLPGLERHDPLATTLDPNPFERDIEAEYRLSRFIYVTTELTQHRPGTATPNPTTPDFNVNLKARWEY